MGRFLIYFSYIGTRYSGVQQQLHALHRGHPVRTVGGVLEEALRALRPTNDVRIQVSSRTDKGVHALRNSCHVDLEHLVEGKEYDPSVITNVANYNLLKRGEDVRVVEARQVACDFSSQLKATGRKYVYRLAHVTRHGPNMQLAGRDQSFEELISELKRHTERSKRPKIPVGNPTPCLDHDRILVFKGKLDVGKLLQAASMISGVHDFTAFSNKPRDKTPNKSPPHPVKLVTIGVKRGQPMGHGLHRCGVDATVSENIEYWDIHVQSKSFLYKMVRRCVGAMVLMARDLISPSELQDILDNPRRDFPFTSSISFSEKGLYLADVEYHPEDLVISKLDPSMSQPTARKAANSNTDTSDENREELNPTPNKTIGEMRMPELPLSPLVEGHSEYERSTELFIGDTGDYSGDG